MDKECHKIFLHMEFGVKLFIEVSKYNCHFIPVVCGAYTYIQ